MRCFWCIGANCEGGWDWEKNSIEGVGGGGGRGEKRGKKKPNRLGIFGGGRCFFAPKKGRGEYIEIGRGAGDGGGELFLVGLEGGKKERGGGAGAVTKE